MSDTPRTDAAAVNAGDIDIVPAHFARQLERELFILAEAHYTGFCNQENLRLARKVLEAHGYPVIGKPGG